MGREVVLGAAAANIDHTATARTAGGCTRMFAVLWRPLFKGRETGLAEDSDAVYDKMFFF